MVIKSYVKVALGLAIGTTILANAAWAQDDDDPLKPYLTSYGNVVGDYEIAPNHVIVIVIAFGGQPEYIDLQTGRFAKLYASASGSMTDSVDTEVSFNVQAADGTRGMRWHQGNAEPAFARRLNLRVEKVNFRNGNVRLAGTLILPEGRGPFPAIVVHGGSDWRVREDYIEQPYIFAASGIAGFIYDKRGWGGSSGERVFSFTTEAGDAVAAAEALKQRPEIEARNIGMSGFSQTGWVVPQAAVMSNDIHFLVLMGAAGTTVARQDLDRLQHTLRANGTPESDVDQALHVVALKNEFARTGRGWDEYLAAAKNAKGKAWDRGASGPLSPTDETWQWMRLNSFYNPLPALEHLSCPVLALWGGADAFVPPDENSAIMELAFDAGNNRDATIRVIPGVSHFFTESIPAPDGKSQIHRYAPEFWPDVIAWVKAHIK